MKNINNKDIITWIKMIIIIVFITLIVENYFMSITIISGQSMMLTIKDKDKIIIDKFTYRFKEPERGDVVIFNPPVDNRGDELFIKRVIAIEGDRFDIKENKVFINGEELIENYIKNNDYLDREYSILKGIVPYGFVFVLGDNRNNSNDSRTFGFVPVENIKGRALTRIWPAKRFTTFAVEYPDVGDGVIEGNSEL